MNFNSIEFFILFIMVFFTYYMIPFRYRWGLLLFSSYIFYMSWNPIYIILILTTTLITYISGIKIGSSHNKRKKMFLFFGVFSSLFILFTFKYLDFFINSINYFFGYVNFSIQLSNFDLLLPIGISFYTFQTLGYVIDVYRGTQLPERHLGKYALYVAFFPQLVAGPIEKSGKLLPQFYKKIIFSYKDVSDGFKLIIWGFFKKLVIADNAAVIVNQVYNNVHKYDEGIYFVIATVLFAFQIYCDFSGYSDIAIGVAKVLGFNLSKNFDRPYHSKSISEFWRRWHITLSVWLRDYLFLPFSYFLLKKMKNKYFLKIKTETLAYIGGITVTMFFGGLWHGANWTFVAWGSILGFFLIFSHITKKIRKKIVKKLGLLKIPHFYSLLRVFITFSMINISWIFFRSNSMGDAIYIIKRIHIGVYSFITTLVGELFVYMHLESLRILIKRLSISNIDFLILISSILFLLIIQKKQKQESIEKYISNKPVLIRWGIYYIMIFVILLFGNFDSSQFIYFQF